MPSALSPMCLFLVGVAFVSVCGLSRERERESFSWDMEARNIYWIGERTGVVALTGHSFMEI